MTNTEQGSELAHADKLNWKNRLTRKFKIYYSNVKIMIANRRLLIEVAWCPLHGTRRKTFPAT